MENEPEGLLAARLVELAHEHPGGVLHVARRDARAGRLHQAATALGAGVEVLLLPGWDCLPYDRVAPSAAVMGARMAVRAALDRPATGPRLLIASTASAGQRLAAAPPGLVLRVGDALEEAALAALGYAADEVVDIPGEFAWRGAVVDVFPALPEAAPHRLELDEAGRIGGIRRFDPLNQRSGDEVAALELPPAREPSGEGASTVFELLPDAVLVLEPEVDELRAEAVREVADGFRLRLAAGEVAPEAAPLVEPAALYLDAAAWKAALAGRRVLRTEDAEEHAAPRRFLLEPDPEAAFLDAVEEARARGQRVALVGEGVRATALGQRLRGRFGPVEEWAGWLAVRRAAPGALGWVRRPLETGFDTPEALMVAAGDVLSARPRGRARLPLPEAFLAPGDAVIHLDHGVAALRGLDRVEGMDCLKLEFAGGAHRLVPVDELDRVWRYGAAAEAVSLDRVGGEAWARRRAEVEASLVETAAGLVEMARAREARRAASLRPPRGAFARFCAGFPHTPTPDQQEAAEAALADLARGRPMDRLVCGDVGFGKTEVALRAAAAVALAGGQVAVLAPTTVLARQHLECFRRRFAPLGIEVGGLSRLTPPAEARAVRAALAGGGLKVVVGTQAILAKATRFAALRLVVVDEEQRFGARQKQALRDFAAGGEEAAHVLAMTATPIPRSLQAALVGLQDLSVIATAPARRQPIRTAVAALEDGLLAEALRRERRRGGQSFVVVPRIEDMAAMRARIRAAAPGLSVVEAHGGLAAAAADDAMIRFAEGRADVLLCTAIIETGLDVPRANTMLVCHAERFGLSQLHQLRGRVGRSGVRGAVWLLTDPAQPPPPATLRRLRALETLDRVGAGFAIAARDLDMRGAGDLLGDAQAGHVRMLGLPLTQHMLDRALRQARGEAVEDACEASVKLPVPGCIPAGYVAEEALRLELHSRLGDLLRAGEEGALEEFAAELDDRFGPPPAEVEALLAKARLVLRCRRLGIARLEVGPAGVAASFPGTPPPARAPVEERNGRLVLKRASADAAGMIAAAWELLDAIGRRGERARAA